MFEQRGKANFDAVASQCYRGGGVNPESYGSAGISGIENRLRGPT